MTPQECSRADVDLELNRDKSNYIDGTDIADNVELHNEQPTVFTRSKNLKRTSEKMESDEDLLVNSKSESWKPHSDGSKKDKQRKRGKKGLTQKSKTGDCTPPMSLSNPKGHKRSKTVHAPSDVDPVRHTPKSTRHIPSEKKDYEASLQPDFTDEFTFEVDSDLQNQFDTLDQREQVK